MCAVSDVKPGTASRFDVDGRRLCVVNIEGEFYVIDDQCTHADYSLSEGDVWEEEREIECPDARVHVLAGHGRAPEPARDPPGAASTTSAWRATT